MSFGSKFDKLYKDSQKYSDQSVEKTVKSIEGFTANYGGTEIAEPLRDIANKNEKQKEGYQKHVIVLTDGQVSNTETVINIIKHMHNHSIAITHMVGIGNGVSFNMIEKGAK